MSTILILEVRIEGNPTEAELHTLMHYVGEGDDQVETVRVIGKTQQTRYGIMDGQTQPKE